VAENLRKFTKQEKAGMRTPAAPARHSMKNPELLSPAGSFDSGFYALRHGADALYLGLEEFSARRAAKNFTPDEFARIVSLARSKGKKVYAALNTLIKEEEMPAAARLLYDLQALEVDGVIVQDFGLLSVMRTHFPHIPVHASTQMGVHNAAGVLALAREGVSRVILARELTLAEIGRIHEACPGVELEVFIHGALCYSFSGLCLASGMLLGRSGNRGECAQLCRGSYAAGDGRTGCWFSRNDLCLGERVLRLRDMGVHALKIEGRMKPPAWVAVVTAFYRAVLDGKSPEEREALLEKSRVIFSRRAGPGFLEGETGDTIDFSYPGHLGVPAGRVEAEKAPGSEKGFTVKLTTDIAVRDGLLYFSAPANAAGGLPQARRFAVTGLYAGGKKLSFAKAGWRVFIPGPQIPGGNEVRKISSHNALLPGISQKFPRARAALRLYFRLSPHALEVTAEPILSQGKNSAAYFKTFSAVFPAQPQAANAPQPFKLIIAARLSPPEDSRFRAGEEPGFENKSGLPGDGIYLNPAFLKSVRRELYARLEEHYLHARQAKLEEILTEKRRAEIQKNGAPEAGFPARAALGDFAAGLPFAADPDALDPERLYKDPAGRVYLPLAPVLLGGAERYLEGVIRFVRRLLSPAGSAKAESGVRVFLGLCNAGHLQLLGVFAQEERVGFFLDYGLYCANSWALRFFAARAPRLAFYYPWVEAPEDGGFTTTLPGACYGGFRPPLFTGRGLRKNALDSLRQGKLSFDVKTSRIAGSWLEMMFLRGR
jgi:putative protease